MRPCRIMAICVAVACIVTATHAGSTNQPPAGPYIGPPSMEGAAIEPHVIPVKFAPASHLKDVLDQMIDFLIVEHYLKNKAKIVADDRTNALIILCSNSDFKFFDLLVRVLDVEVKPKDAKEPANQAAQTTSPKSAEAGP